MLSNVELCGNYFIFTFNTDHGSDPISVNLSSFVSLSDLANYATQEWVKEQNYLSSVPDTYKTYNDILSSLSSDGYATTTYAIHNLSGVANAISMPLSLYESISATADAETLYVITED